MTSDLARGLIGGAAALGIASSVLVVGWVGARRLLPETARLSIRWSAVATVALGFVTLGFWALVAGGWFHLAVLGVASLVSAAAAGWLGRGAVGPLGKDLALLRAAGREAFRGFGGGCLAALLTVAGVGLLRALVAPPLAWDALAYHLVRAGRVVQSGGLVAADWPADWQFYEYFPWGGDLFWAGALAAFPSGLLVPVVGTLLWGTALLGLYATARELGAGSRLATLAATAVGAMPATVGLATTAHVDNAALAFFVLGQLFLLRTLAGSGREGLLACLALGGMAGVRVTTLPLAVAGVGLLVWARWRSRPWGNARTLVVGFLLSTAALGVGAPSYWRAWRDHGSPVYPVPVTVGGTVWSRGSETLRAGIASVESRFRLPPGDSPARHLFWAPGPGGSFINPGPGSLLLLPVAVLGAASLARRRRWAVLLLLGAASVASFGLVATDGMASFRTTSWANQLGRFLLPGFAALALLAAAAEGVRLRRVAEGGLLVATWLGLVWALPRGCSFVELPGLGAAGILIAAAGFALRRAWWGEGRRRLAGVLLLAVGLLGSLEVVRKRWRYPYYEDASLGHGGVFQGQPLDARLVQAFPVWRALDRDEPLRLAVVTGGNGSGGDNYRLPLLGSRLQNQIFYLPATAEGSGVESFPAWRARLRDAGIDYVVQLSPVAAVEVGWLAESPRWFRKEVAAPEGAAVAYRVLR